MLEMEKIPMTQHFWKEEAVQVPIHGDYNSVSACQEVCKNRKELGYDSEITGAIVFIHVFFTFSCFKKSLLGNKSVSPGFGSRFCSG